MGQDGIRSLWNGSSRPKTWHGMGRDGSRHSRDGTGRDQIFKRQRRDGTRPLWDGSFCPGPVASLIETLQKIQYYQKQVNLIFFKTAFQHLCHEIFIVNRTDFHWQTSALNVIQVAAEQILTIL